MPYIEPLLRTPFDDAIDSLVTTLRDTTDTALDGDLNYIITRVVTEALQPAYPYETPWSYKQLTRAGNAFLFALLEFVERAVKPKEAQARKDNGDLPAYAAIDSYYERFNDED